MTGRVSVLGEGTRTIEYEANQISVVFKMKTALGERDVDPSDFEVLDNGNIGISIDLPHEVQLQRIGKFDSVSYTIEIEYVNDYPLTPPNIYIR